MSAIRCFAAATVLVLAACTKPDPLDTDPLAFELRGRTKLEQLFARGQLRPATQADIDAYNAAASDAQPDGRPPYVDRNLTRGRAYVVLQPVVVSLEWNVISGRNLIVPAGVAPPNDPFPLFSYYFIATGRCTEPGGKCPGAPKFNPDRYQPRKPPASVSPENVSDDWGEQH